MNKENFDDMKDLFSKEVELPESLSKQSVVNKIKQSNVKQKKAHKFSRIMLRTVAAAAAFAVVLTGSFLVYEKIPVVKREVTLAEQSTADTEKSELYDNLKTYTPIDVGTKAVKLSSFNSQKDLENYFYNISAQLKKNYRENIIKGFFSAAKEDSVNIDQGFDMAESSSTFNTSPPLAPQDDTAENIEYGKTNTQVVGVDEADIIKNDGNFLYILSHQKLFVVDAGTMTLVSQTDFSSSEKKLEISVSDIYVNGDRLVATGYEYEKKENNGIEDSSFGTVIYDDSVYYSYWSAKNSVSIVFDISDRANIKELRRVRQDGSVLSSRMVGTYLYVATRYSLDVLEDKNTYVPAVAGEKLGASEIYIEDAEEAGDSYVVLSGYDTANTESPVSKVSVLCYGQDVYCSSDTLYVTEEYYDSGKTSTAIHAFSLEDGVVAYKGSGSVPGATGGQYMMDQSGGYFRIATTFYNIKTDMDESNLYVLDSNLNVIGKLENIAQDEQIKSVRFMGNTAYVVTFRNTDPLFAIDLSDPSNPAVLGSVKLPGFSKYLHPLSETLLVGIGYSGDEENADFSKIKISLFDVSDKKNPKELDSHIIKDAYCDIDSSSAKAFLTIDENTFGIPVCYNSYDSKGQFNQTLAFKVFSVENGKFAEKNVYVHGSNDNGYVFFRGTFISDRIYTVSDSDIKQFDMNSEELLASLEYFEESEEAESLTEESAVDYNGETTTNAAQTTKPLYPNSGETTLWQTTRAPKEK